MKIVIAMDSFKGSLTSLEAGEAVARGIVSARKDSQIQIKPLADGGEGTAAALTEALKAEVRTLKVTGPLGSPIIACYGFHKESRIALIDVAQAAGLTLAAERRNPLTATTYGVGELIRDALDLGAETILIGLGGSATCDGGLGMLSALGFGFLDESGNPCGRDGASMERVYAISDAGVKESLRRCQFRAACDVTNPLLGPNGAAFVFAPQKGADQEACLRLENGMKHYARVTAAFAGRDDSRLPGAGAAGGLGFAFLSYLNGRLEPGGELFMKVTGLEEALRDADYLVTGEGRLDAQTAMGKGPLQAARLAKRHGARVIALGGTVAEDAALLNDQGMDGIFSILRTPMTLAEAMEPETAKQNLETCAAQIFRLL